MGMIAAILLRDFAASQEKRLNPRLAEKSLVLIEPGKNRPKVIAPDGLSRQTGVKEEWACVKPKVSVFMRNFCLWKTTATVGSLKI
jgi:hypothetical protein